VGGGAAHEGQQERARGRLGAQGERGRLGAQGERGLVQLAGLDDQGVLGRGPGDLDRKGSKCSK
jgi:hypothetical protein